MSELILLRKLSIYPGSSGKYYFHHLYSAAVLLSFKLRVVSLLTSKKHTCTLNHLFY